MQLDLKIESSALAKALTNVEKQIPFAASLALNDVAFDIRKEIVEKTYPRSFEVRNKSFPKTAFRVKKANKRKLEALIYDRTESQWLSRQAFGGIKRAQGGGRLAIPTYAVKRTATGRVRALDTPTKLLNTKGFKVGKGVRQSIMKPVAGRVVPYYRLRKQARIPARFPFYDASHRVARHTYPKAMQRRLRWAIRTAR
jgi:hypothetical protein